MKKHRDYFIDLLKFVFALLIVLYHSKNLVENEGDSIFIGGVISVEFFFLTSGYYFAKSAAKKTEYYGGTLGGTMRTSCGIKCADSCRTI